MQAVLDVEDRVTGQRMHGLIIPNVEVKRHQTVADFAILEKAFALIPFKVALVNVD